MVFQMRVYTPLDLHSALDDDIVWRRREITTLVTIIKAADALSKNVLIRSAIPLLYAHWEGFGKNCGIRYLEHVSYKAKRFRELKPSFIYLSVLPSLKEMANGTPDGAIKLLKKLYDRLDDKNKDHFRKRVGTKSNLRFDVLSDMLAMCGISSSPFQEYESFIDKELCDPRNEIAHGVGGSPSLEVFLKRRNRAFELMMHLQTEIVNSASLQTYLA
jgi:hypothetical protein